MALEVNSTLETNITAYNNILSAVLSPGGNYEWPNLCQGLDETYAGLNADFRYFNACTIYPDLIQGLSDGAFNANRSFVDQLSNYRIRAIDNTAMVSQDIIMQTVSFLLRTCMDFDCNRANQLVTCDQTIIMASGRLSQSGINSCRDSICANTQPYVRDDPDIGGIGIFISYILQLLLVLMMTVYILLKFMLHRRRTLWGNRHTPFEGSVAFPYSLQEFQKLQSWFIGALVTAAAIRQTSNFIHLSVTDFLFLGGISVNGVVLICYMNAALLVLGRKSWYVYCLSSITFLLCSAFLIYTNWIRGERVDNMLPGLYFCRSQLSGSKHSLQIINWVTLVSKVPDYIIYVAWIFCALIQIGCLFWMLEWEKRLPVKFLEWTYTRLGQAIIWIFVFIIMLCFMAILALQLIMLYNFWAIVDPNQWTFGQIIAITIWFPLIIDCKSLPLTSQGEYNGLSWAYTKLNFEKSDFYCRHKEKKGFLIIPGQTFPKGMGSDYSVNSKPGNPPSGGRPAGSSISTVQTAQTHFDNVNPSNSDRQPTHSEYNYPPPKIHVDTHSGRGEGPPTISPTIISQSHFGSPLLPSIPSSPLFAMHQPPFGSATNSTASSQPFRTLWNIPGLRETFSSDAPSMRTTDNDTSRAQSGVSEYSQSSANYERSFNDDAPH
ncbi:hypothetical protein AA313_de0200925 [Arthrobotrys entomopaga]|nr:hypothetical protein AA313_de0200925 [Arthrobotrys entomopaga]